ncbi:class I SAM-dependent methyltransferase [Bradyrhizobium jicamae]|uniref:Class I SAM-dependent methyltransferase n=1 Tax=Bradyrhizobium jicamae TaxID=280332 RepID=A0ABS5FQ75_9BRAD|nr:class I SAM-dependent methyltransferase [Bradyrhizobium jicamae]MBR0798947.1 class I SAM-dependent methyltransferase [Bradyrhizobium jicamae]
MFTIQDLFKLGMKRDIPELIEYRNGLSFDVGTHEFKVANHTCIGMQDWPFPRYTIPAQDASVTTVHAYDFLEHLPEEDAIRFFRELERVMIPGRSVFNFSVPYHGTGLAVQDLTHETFWCEDSFKTLFHNWTCEPDGRGPWRLKVHALLIIGIVPRNLALLGQLVRHDDGLRTETSNDRKLPVRNRADFLSD